MTSFAGEFLFTASDGLLAPAPTSVYTGASGPSSPVTLVDAADMVGGAFTSERPAAIRTRALDGDFVATFKDDFYNQIFLLDPIIAFGAVATDITITCRIWNAFFVTKTCTAVTPPDGEGVTVGGPTPSFDFGPLELIDFPFTASAAGTPAISGDVEFDFTGLSPSHIIVTGLRSVLFPFPPNWAQASYKVTREYKTDVWTSDDGKEQRRALRNRARKSVGFSATLTGTELLAFGRAMEQRRGVSITIPDWSRQNPTSAPAVSDLATLPVAAVPDWAVAGANVTCVSGSTIETRRVLSTSTGQITFTGTSANAWGAATILMPAMSGKLATALDATRLTNGVRKVDIVFAVTPTSEPEIDPPDADVTFNGREVFLGQPNWATSPTLNNNDPYETLDFGAGAVEYFQFIDFSTSTETGTYTGRTTAEAEGLEQVFERAQGQRGEFYRPTGENDLPLKVAASSAANSFRVDGSATYDAFNGSTVFAAICILMNDGSRIFGKVHDLFLVTDELGTDTMVELTALLGTAIDPDTVTMISWMPVWRFAADNLVTEWQTDSVAQLVLNQQTIEDTTPE